MLDPGELNDAWPIALWAHFGLANKMDHENHLIRGAGGDTRWSGGQDV